MKETLSALVDAELKKKERGKALDRVVEDAELRAVWGRYHVTRAILRKEWDGDLGAHFSAQVMAAIANEPRREGAALPRLIKGGVRGRQAIRFALAASLTAAAALFGLRMTVVGERAPVEAPFKTALVAPLMVPQPYIERAHWQDPRWRNRLDAFLLEHAAVAPLAGMNGLSYVHLAAYNGPSRGARNKP